MSDFWPSTGADLKDFGCRASGYRSFLITDRRRQLAKAHAYQGRGNEIVTFNIESAMRVSASSLESGSWVSAVILRPMIGPPSTIVLGGSTVSAEGADWLLRSHRAESLVRSGWVTLAASARWYARAAKTVTVQLQWHGLQRAQLPDRVTMAEKELRRTVRIRVGLPRHEEAARPLAGVSFHLESQIRQGVDKVFLHRHPQALGDLFFVRRDLVIQRRQAADKVDVRLVKAIPVPVPETDQPLELCLDPRLFQDFALDAIHNVLALVQSPARKLVVFAPAHAMRAFPNHEQFTPEIGRASCRERV